MAQLLDRIRKVYDDHQDRKRQGAREEGHQQALYQTRDALLGLAVMLKDDWSQELARSRSEYSRVLPPERGDKILSPKDARCVYWDIASEVTDEADAVSVMRALYPTHPTNPYAQFFEDQTCKIVAYLLTYSDPRPSCADYAYWLARPEEIFQRVAGSEHEQTLSPKSPNMVNSILATLNTVGYALSMTPDACSMSSIP